MTACGSLKSFTVKSAMVCASLFCSIATANAAAWVCTYADENNQPTLIKFDVGDGVLVDGKNVFKIIDDNDLGLVAVYSYIKREPSLGHSILIMTMTFMVQKELENSILLVASSPAHLA